MPTTSYYTKSSPHKFSKTLNNFNTVSNKPYKQIDLNAIGTLNYKKLNSSFNLERFDKFNKYDKFSKTSHGFSLR